MHLTDTRSLYTSDLIHLVDVWLDWFTSKQRATGQFLRHAAMISVTAANKATAQQATFDLRFSDSLLKLGTTL